MIILSMCYFPLSQLDRTRWLKKWHTTQFQDINVSARWLYSLESISVQAAWYQWSHSSHAGAICPQLQALLHMTHGYFCGRGHGFCSIPAITRSQDLKYDVSYVVCFHPMIHACGSICSLFNGKCKWFFLQWIVRKIAIPLGFVISEFTSDIVAQMNYK